MKKKWMVEGFKHDARKCLAQAQTVLFKYFEADSSNDHFHREVAISRFSSEVIHDCITGAKVAFVDSSKMPKLKRPEVYEEAILALKEVVCYFVIDGPQMAISQAGQRAMIGTVYEFFHREASRLAKDSDSPNLPPITLHRAKQATNAATGSFPPDPSRIACDAVCELTELQVVRIHSYLTGTVHSPSELFRAEW